MDENLILHDINRWILEDNQFWDETSLELEQITSAKVVAKQTGFISGLQVVEVMASHFGLEFVSDLEDGARISDGDIILFVNGKCKNILSFERICLNILSHMSGITTTVAKYTERIKKINQRVRLAATRKTLPGLRRYQKWAVRVGGGDTHRMSLGSMLMLKENHLSQFKSISDAIKTMRVNMSFSQKLEVEVRNDDEAREAVKEGADIVMLDNYTPTQITQVIDELRKMNDRILIEASGNINENTLDEYAASGVDIISMGRLTHSVEAFDFSMIFHDVEN